MASGYVDFSIETDQDAILDAALDYLQSTIPGYVPRESHLEVILLGQLSRMVAEARQVAALVPAAIFQYFGESLLNVPFVAGAKATANTTWTMVDTAGYTIRAGTAVGYRIAGDQLVAFTVRTDVVVPPGNNTTALGQVIIDAIEVGAEHNGLGPTGIELIDALAYVSTITATAATAGGVDTETADAYLDRLREELSLLAPRPILPDDFAVLARRITGVHRALGLDGLAMGRTLTDVARTSGSAIITSASANFASVDVGRSITGTGIPAATTILSVQSATQATMSANATATATGATVVLADRTGVERAITVALVTSTGAAVTSAVKAAVIAYLDAEREVNFLVYTTDPTFTTINVAFTITISEGHTPATVVAAAQTAVAAFINPATWGGGDESPPEWRTNENIVRVFEVAHVIYEVDGVEDVTALTLNGGSANITLTGNAPLPQLGTNVGTAA